MSMTARVSSRELFLQCITEIAKYSRLISWGSPFESSQIASRLSPICIKNVVWVFSGKALDKDSRNVSFTSAIVGTRPNMLTEITVTSGIEPIDISSKMSDFKLEHIFEVLSSYFAFSEPTQQVSQLCHRLCGPPKLVYFFLKAAAEVPLDSQQALIAQWEAIEHHAVRMFRSKIQATYRGNLDQMARNLCLIHASSITLNQDFFDLPELPQHLIHLVEAGLLRIHNRRYLWRLFAPNRFLVQIFRRYVNWYTWERLEMLKSLIQSSSLTITQCGKVFEFLFALELCNSADCKLWKFFSSHVNLQPLPTWNPTILQMKTLHDCIEQDGIYVQVDPDLHTSKVDVVFFACEMSTGNVVRVLVQLTTSPCTVKKVTESLNYMLTKASPLQNN
jgi:hypothetical protein